MTTRSALELAAGVPWLITDDGLRQVLAVAERANLDPQRAAELAAAREERPEAVAMRGGRRLAGAQRVVVRDDVAVLPIVGPIIRYATLFSSLSGATSLQSIAHDFQIAMDDPAVAAIVLHLDTPGGEARGVGEFAAAVRAASKQKRVVAYAGDMAASAGYWIGSSAGEFVLSRTALVGSVGARMAVLDTTMADAKDGFREVQIVSSNAPRKGADPTSPQGRADIQAILDALEAEFIAGVAAGRGVTAEHVIEHFGKGALIPRAADAIAVGMADRLGDFETLIRDLSAGKSPRQPRAAAAASPKEIETMSTKDAATMTAAEIAAANPAAAEALRAEGYGKGKAEADVQKTAHDAALAAAKTETATAVSTAVTAERERIAKIDRLTLKGHEALAVKAKAEGLSAEAFAVAQTEAEQQKGGRVLETLRGDEAALKAPAPSPTSSGGTAASPTVDQNLPIDERAKAEWDSTPSVRTEFAGDFKAYVAFRKAEDAGRVKRFTRSAA